MDNITHSLVGYTLGRAVSKEKSSETSAILWTTILGNNIPDFDILLKPFVVSGNLGYLLHHRGYSHTFFASLFLGIISATLGARIGGKGKFPSLRLCFLGWISVLLHIGADLCNNYGVHLGSPFWNPWLYGDFIFIVEPLIWICTLPLVFYTAQSKISRSLAVFLGIILMLLVWSCKFNPWTVALGLTLFGIFFIFIQKTFRNSIPAILGITFILMSFKLGSHLVKKEVEQVLHQTAPQSISQQLSTTPAPGNPFCWSIISLSTDSAKDLYLVQKGNYSFLPNLFPPQTCALRMSPSQLAESHPSTLLSTSHLVWTDEFRKSLQEFKQLEKDSCAFRSFLKFSRIPIWFQFQGSLAAIDLRYDQKDRQFTWVDLNEKQNCPEVSPPWRYPTEGIFNPIKAQD